MIAGCVLVVAAVGPVFSIISKVSGGVSSLIGIISKIAPVLGPIKTGFAAVNAVMAANPILIIIAAVAALIAIFVTLYNKCEWFRDGVNDIFGAVANFIKGAIDKIKGFFDFDWKLPKIKLPHFKASGEWSLSPLKVPKISVDWYANGGILNSPTIFGANGDSLMGGGEAGKEAVLPIKLLKDYIREENDANNATLAAMIVEAFKSISMTAENNIYIGDKKSITLLTNNTQAASTAFVTSAISTAMAGITKLDFQVVQTLPSTGVKGTFYLIANSGRGQNVYDEYLWINNKYEKLGTREIDLSSYIKQSDMVAITNSEIDAAFA